MAIDGQESFEDLVQRWAAANDSGDVGDIIETDEAIRNYLDANMSQIGTVITDLADLPQGAESRAQTFHSESDMLAHWLGSGLINFDQNGNVVPSPILIIHKIYDPFHDDYEYEVYIDYED